MVAIKPIHWFTIIASLASILLGAYYKWGFVLVFGTVEEDIIFWGMVSVMLGTAGLMLSMLPFLMPKAASGFRQKLIRVVLALWHVGIFLLQIIPVVFWFSGGMVSDNPYARKAVFWGAVPHIALLLLAVATLYQILKNRPAVAKKV